MDKLVTDKIIGIERSYDDLAKVAVTAGLVKMDNNHFTGYYYNI